MGQVVGRPGRNFAKEFASRHHPTTTIVRTQDAPIQTCGQTWTKPVLLHTRRELQDGLPADASLVRRAIAITSRPDDIVLTPGVARPVSASTILPHEAAAMANTRLPRALVFEFNATRNSLVLRSTITPA